MKRGRCLAGEVYPSASRYDRIEEVSLAECALGLAQQLLLHPRELGERERKSRIVAERAQVAQVIGEALELEAKRAQPDRPVRHEASGHAFDRLTVGPREGDGGVARNARREAMAFQDRELREACLDALVCVAESFLEP